MMDGVEAHQSDQDEVDRDDIVQQARNDQDQNARNERNQRRDMGDGEVHERLLSQESTFAGRLSSDAARRGSRGGCRRVGKIASVALRLKTVGARFCPRVTSAASSASR